jgi:predicted HicB family RNase H-like nuclease
MEKEVKLTVRIPETVHGRLADLAKRERRSLNAQLVVLLEQALGTRPADQTRSE